MNLFYDDYLFHHINLSKKPQCKRVKFKRAFQFLQLVLLQRIYRLDLRRHSIIHRSNKQQSEFEVFLGGSCNPTTWRYEQAIPYFQSRSISFYNPQVANWTPDLVDIEHRAKESAPLLFFVIDHSTRSLAAIAEVCYLAARGRNLMVVMHRMPEERNQTKFLQQKNPTNENDNENDYRNVCQARRTLRLLLQCVNLPVFDDIRVALDCAALVIKNSSLEEVHSRQTVNESDDDGYSSNRTSSRSPSPVASEFGDSSENQPFRFQLVLNFCTLPFRFLQHLFRPSVIPSSEPFSSAIFDLYIAFGNHDAHWLNTIVFPSLDKLHVTYTKREISVDDDVDDDLHTLKQSRLLYYLINDHERLSHLTTELAFVMGDRQHLSIVYLQTIIDEHCEEILSKTERQDIERSRKYLDNLAKKEKIFLYRSREESWQRVLAFYRPD